MKIGTKTLLFGCHQFIIHPWFVYRAWKRIYRARPDFWETICIIIHDWGYWGCADIDGPEGDKHPWWAAQFVTWNLPGVEFQCAMYCKWLCLGHSRTLAKKYEQPISKLYWADKFGTVSMPPWLWVWLGKFTGEMEGYTTNPKYAREDCGTNPYKHFQHFKDTVHFNFEQEFKEFY